MSHSRVLALSLALVIVHLPNVASACAACYGQSDDPMARGMNMGIFALLIVVVGVLSGIAGVGIFFAARSARLARTGISGTEPADSTLTHSP